MPILLDTTVLIDCLRGRPASARVLKLGRAGDLLCTTAINVEEEAGARRLFAGLQVLRLEGADGWRAGTWRREFARGGRTLSQADCLIAAAAFRAGAELATGNPAHFPMEGVRVREWPVGR